MIMDTQTSLRRLILDTKARLPQSLIAMENLDAVTINATLELATRFQQADPEVLNFLFRGKVIGTLF